MNSGNVNNLEDVKLLFVGRERLGEKRAVVHEQWPYRLIVLIIIIIVIIIIISKVRPAAFRVIFIASVPGTHTPAS